jgi:integrase
MAWKRQRALKRKYSHEEVPDIAELVTIINQISIGELHQKYQSLRAKALFAMYYLTGCRVSEITRCEKLRKQRLRKKVKITDDGVRRVLYAIDENKQPIIDKWVEEHDYLGVKKKDIKFRKVDGKRCMLIRTENRKNKDRITKRQPIPIEYEKDIALYIYKFIKYLADDDLLFPFGVKRATQIINVTTGFNIHFIRHIRATHLVTKYDFNDQMLVKFMGWSDSRPAKYYMELKSTDLVRQFYKNG